MVLSADAKTRIRRRSVEFIMIVVGVMAALAADASWDANIERRRSEEYLARISTELRINIAIVDTLLKHTARVQAATDTLRFLFEERSSSIDNTALIINAYNATRRWRDLFTTSTFDDMESSGNLQLIRDPALRTALVETYGTLRSYEPAWYGQEYRDAARRAIPLDVQLNVRSECGAIAAPSWTGCRIPMNPTVIARALQEMRANDDLRGAYRIQAHDLTVFANGMVSLRRQLASLADVHRP